MVRDKMTEIRKREGEREREGEGKARSTKYRQAAFAVSERASERADFVREKNKIGSAAFRVRVSRQPVHTEQQQQQQQVQQRSQLKRGRGKYFSQVDERG